jgi:hypothetical protein
MPDARRAAEFWSRLLLDRWSPGRTDLSAVVAGTWADAAFARLGARHGELILRTSEMTPGLHGLSLRSARVEGKVDALRDLPAGDSRPLWITLTDAVECDLKPLDEVPDPRVKQWPLDPEQLAGRRELLELLEQKAEAAGAARLADAEVIIDVGFGVGNPDGFEEIIVPLEKLLRQMGVSGICLGASRKVTDELKVLPSSQQIGQTGQSVNPLILLAIGVSGAPQHLNYIGPRATILAFNRDPEAPIMTLNERQARPRVFPIVGDLFQTVPSFMSALRELTASSAEEVMRDAVSTIRLD